MLKSQVLLASSNLKTIYGDKLLDNDMQAAQRKVPVALPNLSALLASLRDQRAWAELAQKDPHQPLAAAIADHLEINSHARG